MSKGSKNFPIFFEKGIDSKGVMCYNKYIKRKEVKNYEEKVLCVCPALSWW